jgi:hypothetical protein
MKPVWMVRSRQVAQKLSFWLTLIGYDPHDRSLSHRIYLIYASIFMSFWAFAMLSLASSGTATVLTASGTVSANQVAAQISLLIFGLWFIFQLWQVSHRSPFVFSEDDAFLICQTPVRRDLVALSWFAGDWLGQAWLFGALGVTFGFAMIDSSLGENVVYGDIFLYVAAGLRALSIFLPLHSGLLALLWMVGALRLQGNREQPRLPRLVLVGILIMVIGLSGSIVFSESFKRFVPVWHAVVLPVAYPLQAAFFIYPWINGILIAMAIAVIGLVALTIAGRNLNLSRCAQESTQREKLETAQRYGMVDLAHEIKQRERLGIGREPTRLPARPGSWVLLWKDILQSRYEIGFAQLWGWLVLLGTSVGFLLAPDFSSRILILFFWLIVVGQRTTSRLRADLRNWWMLRSLPFHAESLLLADLAISWSATVAIAWLAMIMGGGGLGASRLLLFLLIPPVCLIVGLISAYDILRQCSTGMLLNGNVPGISWRTLVGGILCLAIPAGVIWLLHPLQWPGLFLAFAASAILAYAAWRMAAKKYRSIS